MLWELSDLVGAGDIAALYSVGKTTVSNWIARYDDFPEPLTHVSGRAVYSRKQVQSWREAMLAEPGGQAYWGKANPNMARGKD